MIERQFVSQKIKEQQVKEYLALNLAGAGYSHTEIKRTPLGEKIIVYTTRPGLVVGSKGGNIKELTETLKKKFGMENPQIEIGDVENPMLDAHYVAQRIASTFERFGGKRFKSVGYKMLQEIMGAGAIGGEILISGKVPSARAKSWRFSAGYLKKSGDIAVSKVDKAYVMSNLRSGSVGIQVRIMGPDVFLPDKIMLLQEVKTEEIKEEKSEAKQEKPKRKQRKKKEPKKEEKIEVTETTETVEKQDGNNKEE
ncbi:30S ribosomal protein S3 [Candidatus Woesearchaeota archaeon]|nr:30S ribosomal protein S3 [Candidatus Woesearchaeota archaeon]